MSTAKDKIERQREKLEAEQKTLERRMAKRAKADNDDGKRVAEIKQTLRRLKFTALIGVDGAVKHDCRFAKHEKESALNDLLGTVESVRGQVAVVNFGNDIRWRMDLGRLALASQTQSESWGYVKEQDRLKQLAGVAS